MRITNRRHAFVKPIKKMSEIFPFHPLKFCFLSQHSGNNVLRVAGTKSHQTQHVWYSSQRFLFLLTSHHSKTNDVTLVKYPGILTHKPLQSTATKLRSQAQPSLYIAKPKQCLTLFHVQWALHYPRVAVVKSSTLHYIGCQIQEVCLQKHKKRVEKR